MKSDENINESKNKANSSDLIGKKKFIIFLF